MAEQKRKEPEGVGQEVIEGGEVKFEPVKKIEEDTFDAVKSLKTFLFSSKPHKNHYHMKKTDKLWNEIPLPSM